MTEKLFKKREPGCICHWEEGDSPCPVHGEDEPLPQDFNVRALLASVTESMSVSVKGE